MHNVSQWPNLRHYTGQSEGQYGMVYDLIILHDAV